MSEPDYSKREIDDKFTHIVELLGGLKDGMGELNSKVAYTNGKVKRLYLILACVSSVVATLLVETGSPLIGLVKLFV